MTAGHTPGPWVPSYFGYQVLTGDSWNTICTLHSSNGDHRLAGWEDGRKATSVEANAWLIAAAPDLLEALFRLKTECEAEGLDKRAGFDCWVSMANQALLKASPTAPERAGHGQGQDHNRKGDDHG